MTLRLKDYHSLFIDHVMKGVLELDKSRRVVGSSPSNGRYDEEHEQWMSKGAGGPLYGDGLYGHGTGLYIPLRDLHRNMV